MERDLWQFYSGVLTNDQVTQIISVGEEFPIEEATIFSDREDADDIRRSKIRWVNNASIQNMLFQYVMASNLDAFGVDVQNFAEMQFTEYHSVESGHYDWHHDINWNGKANSDRKLSITVQLSDPDDYEGGTFEFAEVETPSDLSTKGSILVFPSYMHHRVLPVTKGIRKSLVAWFHGPRWR